MTDYPSGLHRDPDFVKLWLGQAISATGSRITRDGLPLIAVLTLAATPEALGILTAITALPVLLFGLPIGAWVDRRRRRPILITCDALRAVVLVTIPVFAAAGMLTLPYLYLVTIITGISTLIFEVAYRAALPGLVGRERLLEANTKLALTESLAEVGGPSIAGLLVQTIGAPLAIAFDAASFAIAAISTASIRRREPPTIFPDAAASADKSAPDSYWQAIRAGITLIARDPVLRVIGGGLATRAFFGSFFGALYALYAVREVGIPPAALGGLISLGGIGALIGAALAGRWVRRWGVGRVIVGGLMVSALTGVSIPLSVAMGRPEAGIILLGLSQIIGDAAMVAYGIGEISLRQSRVPDHLLGRANATLAFMVEGIAPIGAVVGGLLGGAIGAWGALTIAAVGMGGVALMVALSPVRRAVLPTVAEDVRS